MNDYQEKTSSLTGQGGINLHVKSWTVSNPKGIVIIAHGLGEHCGRYGRLINTMKGQNVSFYALDHRGHGRSGGNKGHIDRFSDYVNDLKLLFNKVRKEEGSAVPIVLLGHSMGGVIAFQYALSYPEDMKALILSSAGIIPAVKIPAVKKKVATVLSGLLPRLAMSNGLETAMLSHDMAMVQAYIDDPLVHDRVTSRFYVEFTRAGEECLQRASELKMPLLIIHGKEDGIVDYRGSEQVMAKASSKDKEIHIFKGLFHETMNEKEKESKKVLKVLSDWILKHI